MPKTSKDMEKLILADGWVLKGIVGSHRQYTHPTKSGKVTIPFHGKDLKKGDRAFHSKASRLKIAACLLEVHYVINLSCCIY